jgi:hypothetical protein
MRFGLPHTDLHLSLLQAQPAVAHRYNPAFAHKTCWALVLSFAIKRISPTNNSYTMNFSQHALVAVVLLAHQAAAQTATQVTCLLTCPETPVRKYLDYFT